MISGTSIFSDSRYTGRTSSLLVAVKGQNMPQNSKYSHPRLGLCRVRDGIFSGQPLLPLKRGLSPKTVLFDTKTCLADSNNPESHSYPANRPGIATPLNVRRVPEFVPAPHDYLSAINGREAPGPQRWSVRTNQCRVPNASTCRPSDPSL